MRVADDGTVEDPYTGFGCAKCRAKDTLNYGAEDTGFHEVGDQCVTCPKPMSDAVPIPFNMIVLGGMACLGVILFVRMDMSPS